MEVIVKNGNIEEALKKLKKKWIQEGMKTEIKNRRTFMTKGQKRRRQKMRAKARQKEGMFLARSNGEFSVPEGWNGKR